MNKGLSSTEALAQPAVSETHKQEPVEWGVDWGKDGNSVSIIKRLAGGNIEVLAWEYAPHAPQRNPLTDEEIYELWTEQGLANSYDIYSLKEHVRRAARAIEAAHGIKGEA